MRIWHGHPDTPRLPARPIPGEPFTLRIGTWPIEPGQSVRVRWPGGEAEARWRENAGANSYWEAAIPGLPAGSSPVEVQGTSPGGGAEPLQLTVRVGARLDVALLWHMHQPLYRVQPGWYAAPWVRLHALRDYHGMGALLLEEPRVRVTFNLTPVLLDQIEEYASGNATDDLLELTRRDAEDLAPDERDRLLAQGFDASWHSQIFPHPRFRELFARRTAGESFGVADVRDLQVWATLAWFDADFRARPTRLVTGAEVDVHRLVRKAAGYTREDVASLLEAQQAVLRAIVPMYRRLADGGRVELTTTPAWHPILPLLVDTDAARLDRAGASLPPRFRWPEDADAQVRIAVTSHARRFGRVATGVWPAEGAVSAAVPPMLARHGLRWFATDRGVLARSGPSAENPEMVCTAWEREGLAVFFRDSELSDAIGFRYGSIDDPDAAADDLVRAIRERYARRLAADGPRILVLALDGENAWGGYAEDGRPFLRALYRRLASDPELATTTPGTWLAGAGPLPSLPALATGSWVDENGSLPGVDLGTWIGEDEENRAWELLGELRSEMAGSNPPPEAWEALYAAEGSDWTWWLGTDQDSGRDGLFDALFRAHLGRAWASMGSTPPSSLAEPVGLVPVLWTFTSPVAAVPRAARLAVRTNCAGRVRWAVDDGEPAWGRLAPVGGVMAGAHRFERVLGPFPEGSRRLALQFFCEECRCAGGDPCCLARERLVRLLPDGASP
ncbi:MAG: hypothetical protein ACOZNI_34995 [Myxococcota bacterium]